MELQAAAAGEELHRYSFELIFRADNYQISVVYYKCIRRYEFSLFNIDFVGNSKRLPAQNVLQKTIEFTGLTGMYIEVNTYEHCTDDLKVSQMEISF